MPTAAQLRQFVRSIDAADVAFWACDESGKIILASQRVGKLVGCIADDLIGVKAISGRSADSDPVLAAAASLAAPPGIQSTRAVGVDLKFGTEPHTVTQFVIFLNVGDTSSITLAIEMPERFDATALESPDNEVLDALQLRRTLVAYRKKQSGKAQVYLAGRSLASKRLRKQVNVARRLCEDTLIGAPKGFPVDAIAHHLHANLADGGDNAPMEFIDGSLMDLELLEAVGAPLIMHLTGGDSAKATATIRDIDQMPMDAQARVAQWKSVFGDRLRIIASAHRESLIPAAGGADWLHPELDEALGAMFVDVPPLSSRPDDLGLLSTAILEMVRVETPGPSDRINRDAMDTLIRYPWPGDVSELEDSLRHAVRVCSQDAIGRDHLPLVVRSFRPDGGPDAQLVMDLDQVLRSVERRLIEQVLGSTDGNRAEAARRLGISRARLLRRMNDVTVDDP